MRRAFLLSFLIVGCGASTVASEPPPKVAATTTSMPPGNNTPAPPAAISATASPAAVIDDSPLPWGTRPSRTGPLFPVVDGVCVHGEMWPLADGTTLYSYGNPSGGYSRGGAATLAVFTDSGLDRNADSFKLANPTKEKGAFDSIAPFSMTGTWSPGPLLVYSNDSGGGRTRDYPTIWQRTPESGWSILTSYGGDDNGPSFGRKPLLFKGNAIVTKFVTDFQGNGATTTVISATKIAKDAATLANIGALTRSDLSEPKVYTNDEELYFSGFLSTTSTPVVRVWKDGKVREVKWPALPKDTYGKIVASKPSLLVMTDKTLHQLEGDTFTTWPITGIPNGSKPKSVAVAPNGDVWIALSPRTMVLKREASSGKITELPVPLPADTNAAKEGELAHWPASGADLAGVEYNDPYVIAEGGQIAHFENGKWSLIEMPKTPFASAGRYRAQLLAMPAKGDLYVNAGYGEKGLGWKTWERYRAILRTKRPNETLRCNEPGGGASWASGKGFMSFPPLADDKCTTPFVMIVRTAYDLSSSSPMVMHDRKSDWPTVRESVKATPSLTNNNTLTTIDLIEFESGDQRYVGAKVPSIQSGKDLVESAAKRVKVVGDIGLRPELLCATTPPKILRTLRVDLATGKVLPQ